MGLFDNVTSAMNRGTAAAERTARTMKLKSQISDINKRRQTLAAQLGASLYEATKDNPELRAGRETLYDSIAQCDSQRDALQLQIQQIEAEAAASQTFTCGVCGARMSEADLFCSGCGTPIAEAKAAAMQSQPPAPTTQPVPVEVVSGPVCPNCGAPFEPGDLFCMSCGASLAAVQPTEPEQVEETIQVEEPEQSEDTVQPLPENDTVQGNNKEGMETGNEVSESVVDEQDGLAVEESLYPDINEEDDGAADAVSEPLPSFPNQEEHVSEEAGSQFVGKQEDEVELDPAPESNAEHSESPSEPERNRVCPNCGAPIMGDFKFCMKCGTKVEGAVN